MSVTPVSDRGIPGQTHYFCRIRMPLVLLASFDMIGVLLAIAWLLLDPAWKPSPPISSRRARLGYSLVLLLVLVPVWIRVPLIVFTALELTRQIIRRLIHTFDSTPDFVISTEGIAGWDRMTFRFIPWEEMTELKVHRSEQRVWGFKLFPTQESIHIYGAETGPRRFFGVFSPRRPCILYSQMFFPRKNSEVLLAIRPYRPDLANEDSLNA